MTVLAAFALTAATSCGTCHRTQVTGFAANTMSRALYRAAEAAPLRERAAWPFRLGRYAYSIEGPAYSVSDGASTLRVNIEYAFGQGAAGQTYVYRHDGRWYESRVSYYKDLRGLDLTMGAPPGEPKSLVEAAGREMTARDVVACFGCHTVNSIRNNAVDFERLQAGVQCDSCHGATAPHAASFSTKNAKPVVPAKLVRLSTEEQSELCGRCHRTWADIATNGPRGIGNVRFQPYRIANSKCYDAADRRIACTACHDPHGPLEKRLAAYDKSCKSCHGQKAKAAACPKEQANCAECHMPRYEIPGSHHLFTDHQIRIVRANETYPN